MCANVTWNYSQIVKNIAETRRLMRLGEYGRINERAADKRADRWLTYTPLTPEQLSEKLTIEDSEPVVTIIVPTPFGAFQYAQRSTNGAGRAHAQYVILHRPTELQGLDHARGRALFMDELPFETIDTRPILRWCIHCQTHHPLTEFQHSPRYLHGLSYACKASKRRRQTWRWLNVA